MRSAYDRGLVDRDGNSTVVGHAATVGMFGLLVTWFWWLPVLLTAMGWAVLLALPAGILFCAVAAPLGFLRNRSRSRKESQ